MKALLTLRGDWQVSMGLLIPRSICQAPGASGMVWPRPHMPIPVGLSIACLCLDPWSCPVNV